MILTKEQINRYLRHVIIPEISGVGQKKLLDTTVILKAKSADASEVLLYYLAAAGIGRIICLFKDNTGSRRVLDNLKDLNHDTCITFSERIDDDAIVAGSAVNIILGSAEYLAENLSDRAGGQNPAIVAISQGWEGYLQVISQPEETSISTIQNVLSQWINHNNSDSLGSIFSNCLLGALITLEVIKLSLNMGDLVEKPFNFSLASMRFDYHKNGEPINFDPGAPELNRVDQGTVTPRRLADCKVLIVGLGGLGTPAAYALARAGIGTIGMVDHDTVSISDLNRQILHSESRLGLPKVDSAEIFLHQLNPQIKLVKYHTELNKDNAFAIFSEYDVIIDGVDNFPTRYLINDTCYLMKKPMIEAGVLRFDGIGLTVIPGESMCYRCLFPDIPAAGSVPSCKETGVLGPVPGVMGFIQACETVKLLTGNGSLLKDTLLAFDALDLHFDVIKTGRNAECPLCGSNPSIRELPDYEFVCSV